MSTIPFPNGGKGVPPEKRTKIDILIRGIYAVLPCVSLDEIRAKLLSRGFDDRQVALPKIQYAIYWLRSHPYRYRWTIPHVKRGNGTEGKQYYAVLLDKEKGFVLPPEYATYSHNGFIGSISHVANMTKSEAIAFKMQLQFEKSRTRREAGEELIGDLEYISKKARALHRRSMNG